jgi:AcrR family transcriptional regulator
MSIGTRTRLTARERILEAGYELFTRRRIRDVGVNEVIARAGVTKATFYNHFASKDDLILAFLELREQRATIEWLEAGTRARGGAHEEQLLAFFDLFDDWFADPEFESCPFIHILLEMGPDHAIGRASIEHLNKVRLLVRRLAEEAGLRDPDAFARAFHILMKGSIVSAVEGDRTAAQPARAMARMLIEQHR